MMFDELFVSGPDNFNSLLEVCIHARGLSDWLAVPFVSVFVFVKCALLFPPCGLVIAGVVAVSATVVCLSYVPGAFVLREAAHLASGSLALLPPFAPWMECLPYFSSTR